MATTQTVARTTQHHPGTPTRSRLWVPLLCWLAVVFDGFDAVVLGTVLPSLIEDPTMNVTAASGTWIASIGLVGMMIGALASGSLTNRFGRRNLLLGSVLAFSLLTALTAFAPGAATIGLLRFLAGIGLGGCLPTAISMVTEFAGVRRGANATTMLMTGYHVGAVITALLAVGIMTSFDFGWKVMFLIGGLPIIALLPVMWKYLPESPQYLLLKGRTEEAQQIADAYGVDLSESLAAQAKAKTEPATGKPKNRALSMLFTPQYRWVTILIWVGAFMGLLLVYGLNTWLPQIMVAADYDLGNSLGFLVVLNAGAVIGLMFAGKVGDRITPRRAAMIWFLCAAVMLTLLTVRLPMGGLYIFVFLTGVFVFSAQNLVTAFAATHFPPEARGAAIGMSLGIGRLGAISGPIIGGGLLTAGLAYPWGFFAFAIVGLLGGIALASARRFERTSKAHQTQIAPQAQATAVEKVEA